MLPENTAVPLKVSWPESRVSDVQEEDGGAQGWRRTRIRQPLRLSSPRDVVADSKGNVYFAQDGGEYRIWKYTP